MFNKEYRFKGRHAERVSQLTAVFDKNSNQQLFKRNIDVYVNAPLIGFLYGRSADLDNSKNPKTNQIIEQHIMGDRVIYSQDDLMFNYRLIMLLDENYESNLETRINKAFRNVNDNAQDIERFESYVRGGVDVLYEKLIENATDTEEYIDNLYEFIDDFQDKFNAYIDTQSLLKMCFKDE